MPSHLVLHQASHRAATVLADLEARGVVRAAGHAILVLIVVGLVILFLIGFLLSRMFRRRR